LPDYTITQVAIMFLDLVW